MKFQKGQSGNPKGRPKGSKDFRANLTLTLAKENQEKIKQVIEKLFYFALKEEKFSQNYKLLHNPWLGKLLLEYFLVKPNNNSTATEEDMEENDISTTTAETDINKTEHRLLKSV